MNDRRNRKRKLSSEEPKAKWECTEFTETGIKFKMEFKNPLGISKKNGSPDKLNINLTNNTFFA